MNLTGHFLNETAIEIQWRRVPKEFRNGIIVGYKLDYKDKTVPGGPWLTITVPNRHNGSDVFNQTIAGLKKYTPYLFRIQAFTYRADGVLSENVTIWTDEGGKGLRIDHSTNNGFNKSVSSVRDCVLCACTDLRFCIVKKASQQRTLKVS